jgi:hypothetical protein
VTQLAEHTRTLTGELCGCAAISPDHRFEVKELGEITMVSMAHPADALRELLG